MKSSEVFKRPIVQHLLLFLVAFGALSIRARVCSVIAPHDIARATAVYPSLVLLITVFSWGVLASFRIGHILAQGRSASTYRQYAAEAICSFSIALGLGCYLIHGLFLFVLRA